MTTAVEKKLLRSLIITVRDFELDVTTCRAEIAAGRVNTVTAATME